MSWAFLADGALLEGQGSLAPVEVSFGVLLDALCPPTHAIVWALAWRPQALVCLAEACRWSAGGRRRTSNLQHSGVSPVRGS